MTNRHVGPRLSVERLARELARTDRRLTTIETAPQLAHSSVDVDGVDYTVPDTVRVGKDAADKAENARQVVEQLDQELADARTALEEADAALQDMLADIDVDMEEHQSRIDELRNVTIPSLENDLTTARQELEQADAQLDERLDVFGGRVEAVETTASEAASAASSAQSAADAATARADEARETAEEALRGQANLMADGMVQPSVALAGGVIRWAAYQETEEVTLYRNGVPVERDGSGPIFSLSTDPGDILTADGPVALWSDELRAALPPLSWAAREFVIGVPSNAAPYQFFVYAPFSAADVTATQGDDPETAETFKVQAGTTTVLSGKGSGKWQFASDERILAGWRGYGGNRSDVARPPHRYNLVYRGGGQDRVATTPDATATATQATGDGYGTNAVLLDWGEGNKGSVYPSADGSGNDMETGATPDTISDFYGLPHALSDYALMAVEPTIVRVEGWNGEEWVLRNEHDFSAASYEAPMGSQVGGTGGGGSNFTVEGPDGENVAPSYWRLRGTGKFYARTNRGTREYAPVGFNATTYVPGTDPTGAAALRQAVQAAQDAAAAQDRADEAHSLAGTAESNAQTAIEAAGAAQDTADGKPAMLFDTGAPSGTAPKGSTWFRVNDSGQVIGQWQQTEDGANGSQWEQREIRSEVIANLDVGKLTAGSAAISEAVVDKLWADVIRARKITSDMLVIGGTRLIDNPIFEPDDSGTWGPGWLHPSEDPTARGTAEFYKPDDLDANAVRFMSDGENGFLINMPNTRRAAVTPGQEVRVAADVKVPDGPGVIFGINFRDRDGNTANNGSAITVPSTGNVWERFEASFVVPDDGSATMEFFIAAILGVGSATVSISNVDMRPKTGPELIVDGAIAARHVNAESVAGAVGTFLDLSADQITSGTIDAGRLNAQEVAAHVGGFLEITTDQLVAGDATIGEAVIDKLWTDTFAARKVTAAEINVQSLAASSAFVSELTANSALVSNLEAQIVRADMFQGNEFTGGTFTGTTFRTGTSGQRVQIDASDGIRAWNGSGQQTLRLSGGDNLIAGQLYTNVPGDPGIILKPVTATGLPGVFFSENGTTDAEQPAIYTDESWRLTIRAKRSNGARGAVRMQGALYMSGSAVTGGLDGQPGTYRWSIDPNGHAEFRSMAIWSGAEWFQVNNGAVGSTMIYNRTGSAGANMIIGSAGWIGRSTSASKYKLDIQDAPVEWHERILALNPRTWIDRPNAERYAEYLTRKGEPGYDEDLALSMIDPVTQRVPGLIAEDVEDAGLSEYVTYGDDGQIEGLAYDRLWTLLIPLVRDLRDRVAALEGASRA